MNPELEIAEIELLECKSDSESVSESVSESITSKSSSVFLEKLSPSDLEELENLVTDLLHHYLEDNFVKWADSDYLDTMATDVAHLVIQDLVDANICSLTDEEYLLEYVKECAELVCSLEDIVPRQDAHIIKVDDQNNKTIASALKWIKEQPQPVQRTPEWYEYRHNLITASNIWKTISSEAQQNSLIYGKCQPQNQNIVYGTVNTSSPLHWGTKYEELTKMLYEERMQVKVEEFGCIQHPVHSFIGASPDGIVTDKKSPLYGRMVEIKNIVNREINGIPSLAYWVQMQVQMETCNLDVCDFVETQIREYESYDEFAEDSVNKKGVVLMLMPTETTTPVYEFMPLHLELNDADIAKWKDSVVQSKPDYKLYETKYWYLEIYSCVTVRRNRRWFACAVPHMKNIWEIILKERETGHEHRAPKKRVAKDIEKKSVLQTYMQVNKLPYSVDEPSEEEREQEQEEHQE